MYVYHEVPSDTRSAVLEHGLLRTSRGEKGSDKSIIMTDQFLDQRCPQDLKQQGISRDNNVYAFVSIENSVIDIASGEYIPVEEFISRSDMTVLRLNIDIHRCFVSDLDTYDELKAVLSNNEQSSKADKLSQSYWNKLMPLANFQGGEIRRPEIMITYDVSPANITVCN